MKKQVSLYGILFLLAGNAFGQFETLPPNPEPGKCYIRNVTPEVYETSEQRVLVRPAYRHFEVVPAEYRTVEDRILVKPAYQQLVVVPAEFRTVTREIEVEPPFTAYTVIPPRFGIRLDSVETRAKTGRWEYQAAPENCLSADPRDCMVLRYVEQPAAYSIFQRKTIEQEATYARTQKNRQTMTITVQELVKPAHTEIVEIPAEYTTVTRRELIRDETVREIEVPAEYRIETIEVLKDKGGEVIWEEIACALIGYNVLPVYFESGSNRLTAESQNVLEKGLLKLMQDKPNIRVEISAHTDSRGAAAENQQLSQVRANALADYLVSRGIQRSRLVTKGYGESRLKNRCADGVACSEAEHAQNRRVEFRVLSN